MNQAKLLNHKKAQRIGRVRAKIAGTAERPRLVVNRTNRYFYAQLVDDATGTTLLAVSNVSAKAGVAAAKAKKSDQAFALGERFAKQAAEKGIKAAVFDRRSYQFHGRVKSFAEGAKKGGLKI
ncbi:MAG TPA: 50S ribosomal protein L18 [Candidatus Paceibacterota bacterium]|nr:50S ribosomal protein L18 [Candidatus Paceibacterota bacterium]